MIYSKSGFANIRSRVFGCIVNSSEEAKNANARKMLMFGPLKLKMNRALSIPSKVVIRGTNWVGDTILSLPALKEIRRIFASSHITLWVRSSLADIVTAAGVTDDVVCFDPNSVSVLKRPFMMMQKLKAQKFDMAILLQNAFESAFTAWLARIPIRAGYPTDLRGPLLNMRVPLTPDITFKHQVFYYLEFLLL